MDIFFGLVIVANGVMMGLTTQGVVDESSEEAQIFELVPWNIAWDITDITFKTWADVMGMWVFMDGFMSSASRFEGESWSSSTCLFLRVGIEQSLVGLMVFCK